jgi:hypothetical protein
MLGGSRQGMYAACDCFVNLLAEVHEVMSMPCVIPWHVQRMSSRPSRSRLRAHPST